MHLYEIWKVGWADAFHFVMVLLHEQVLADTSFSEARLHISLSGAIGSCESNTSFQMFPDFRKVVTVF